MLTRRQFVEAAGRYLVKKKKQSTDTVHEREIIWNYLDLFTFYVFVFCGCFLVMFCLLSFTVKFISVLLGCTQEIHISKKTQIYKSGPGVIKKFRLISAENEIFLALKS